MSASKAEVRKALKNYRDIDDNRILFDYLNTRTLGSVGTDRVRRAYWTTSAQITAHTGLSGVRIRQLMQLFPTTYTSSTFGYKLTMFATPEEIKANVQSLLKRARKIVDRAAALTGRV